MFEDSGKDILSGELEFMFLSVVSKRLKVLVVGGGRAGLIKTESFSKKGCILTVVSPCFTGELQRFAQGKNVELIKDNYKENYILDKHIVIIATNDDRINSIIKNDCDRHSKLYLHCADFKKGIVITPSEAETKNIHFALHTKGGGPKTSKMLLDVMKKTLENYDGYVEYICKLREKIKGFHKKSEIMNFVSTPDFKFFYEKQKQEYILKMFYGG